MRITATVNGKRYDAEGTSGGESLLDLLRDRWGLIGTKNACEEGECGSCTVLLAGTLVNSCLVLGAQADGLDVTTVEGLGAAGGTGGLHPVQGAFLAAGAVQCGYCTPGMVLAAADLLRRCPRPSDAEIRWELAGNLCRCTGYQKIVEAVLGAAEELSTAGTPPPATAAAQRVGRESGGSPDDH